MARCVAKGRLIERRGACAQRAAGRLGAAPEECALSQVRCKIRDAEGGVETIVLGAGEFFGEKALVRASKSAATMLAVGHVSMLQLTQAALEDALGPLNMHAEQVRLDQGPQSRVSGPRLGTALRPPSSQPQRCAHDATRLDARLRATQADAWKRSMVLSKEIVLRKQLAATLNEVEFAELEPRGTLFVTGASSLVLMEHSATAIIYTVHCIDLREVAAAEGQVRSG